MIETVDVSIGDTIIARLEKGVEKSATQLENLEKGLRDSFPGCRVLLIGPEWELSIVRRHPGESGT